MIIEITDVWGWGILFTAYPHRFGLELISPSNSYNGYTYEVINKQLFMLSVIKHGFKFKEINDYMKEIDCSM